MIEPYKLPHIITLSHLLVSSYKRWTGWELVGGSDIAYALFYAPFPITSQDTQGEPLIQYANQAALDLWETEWKRFIGMPAYQSAEPDENAQMQRNELLVKAREKGWTMHYNGIRVSSTGRRFEIINTVLWNIVDDAGRNYGHAARIGTARYL